MADENANDGASEESKGKDVLTRFESFLKLIAGGAAISAAIGIPAVYTHYSSLGIPSSLITYEQILRAGVAPALFSLFVGGYIALAYREYKEGASGWGPFMLPGIVFAPVPMTVIAVIFVGLGAGGSWLCWWMLWPVYWLLRVVAGWELPTSHLVFATVAGCFFLFAVPLAMATRGWWQPKIDSQSGWLYKLSVHFENSLGRRRNVDKRGDNAKERPKPQSVPAPPEGTFWENFKLVAIITGMVAMYLTVSLYAIRWYLAKLGIDPGYLTRHSNILLFVVVGSLGVLFVIGLLATWPLMRSGDKTKRLLVTSLNLSIALGVFALAVWIYSVNLYPAIPAAFGGGQRDPVTVWISTSDLPLGALRVLPDGKCSEEKEVVRCDDLFLVHRSSEDVLIADSNRSASSAVLVPRSAIKAISWRGSSANGKKK